MKTLCPTTKFIGLASLLVVAFSLPASLAFAGSGPRNGPPPATPTKQTDNAKPSAPTKMDCPACKTIPHIGAIDLAKPNPGFRPRTPDVGFKHICRHCGGELTAMKGRMTNAMQGNCAMCGKDAERCVAAQHPAMTA